MIFPDDGSTSFKSSFISVDLPEPLRPIIKTNSPSSIVILIFLSALFPALYVLLRLIISIIFCVSLNYRIAAAQIRDPYHSIPRFPLFRFASRSHRYRSRNISSSIIKVLHILHVFNYHKRNFKGYGIFKYPQIQTGTLLKLVKTVHQRVPVDIELSGRL